MRNGHGGERRDMTGEGSEAAARVLAAHHADNEAQGPVAPAFGDGGDASAGRPGGRDRRRRPGTSPPAQLRLTAPRPDATSRLRSGGLWGTWSVGDGFSTRLHCALFSSPIWSRGPSGVDTNTRIPGISTSSCRDSTPKAARCTVWRTTTRLERNAIAPLACRVVVPGGRWASLPQCERKKAFSGRLAGGRGAAGETVDPSEYYFRACEKIEKPQLNFVIPAKAGI